MNILVCGGAGFIGANFLWYERNNYPQDKIICVDALTYAANFNNIKKLLSDGNYVFIKADICDETKMRKIFEEYKPDIVVNFAAQTHVDRSIANSSEFIRTNVEGVRVLLDCCNKYSIRFHQISTDEVYGDLSLNSNENFDENSPLKASNPYSASKAAADLLTLAYFRTHNTSITISRCSNNFGKFQHLEKFIPKIIYSVYNKKPITVYGKGENMRSWLSVQDNCRAVDLIIRKGIVGEIYNVGGGCELSNISLIDKIFNIMNDKTEILFVQDRKGHDIRYRLNADKIYKDLSFLPNCDFYQSLKSTVQWYLNLFKQSKN